MSSKLLLLVCLAALTAFCWAEEQPHEEESHQEDTGLSAINLPGDFAISEGVVRAIGVAGALVTGVAGLAAILSFILPLFGFRTCMLMGNCEQDTTAYNTVANSVYDQQHSGYQYGNGFKKRSLEVVGPILHALTAAYDKFAPSAQKRSIAPKPVESK